MGDLRGLPQIRRTGGYVLPPATDQGGFFIFSFDGREIVIFVGADGAPWFQARSLSAALGYANLEQPSRKLCDPRGRRQIRCNKDNGWKGDMVFIDEANLFRMLVRCSRSNSDKLQRFFVDVVLPSVRRAASCSSAILPDIDEKLLPKIGGDGNGQTATFAAVADTMKILAETGLSETELDAMPRIIAMAARMIV